MGSERRDALTIRLFGPELRVSLGGLPLSGSIAPKARALLAYLVLNGRGFASREVVASALWPDCEDRKARHNLRRQLSQLVKYLPSLDGEHWIDVEGGLRWNPASPATIDACEFDRLGMSSATRADAVDLYNGELLELSGEEWLEPIRERYRTRAVEWLSALVDAHEPYDAVASVRFARALLKIDPLREDVLRRMMRILVAGGDRTGALREFTEFRIRLEKDLGVSPAPETLELAERIASDSAAGVESPGVSRAPAAVDAIRSLGTAFVGRENDCRSLTRLLLSNRLVSVVGIGGLGKSRLIRQFLQFQLQHGDYPSIVVEPKATLAAPSVDSEILEALGLSAGTEAEAARLLADHVRDRRLLIVLDGCERRLDAVRASIDRLLPAAPSVSFLTTSREPIGTMGEVLHRLGPLAVPVREDDASENIISSEAGALFLDRSHAFSAGGDLSKPDREALVAICHKLGGIPLAIELAAARRRMLSIRQIAQRLSDPALVLDASFDTSADQQSTVRTTIAWSFDSLSSAERAFLRSLCIFEGPFAIEAAERMLGSVDGAPSLIEALAAFIDRALVIIIPDTSETRYSILDPIREFGLQELVERGEAARAYGTAVGYYLDFCNKLALPEGEPAPRLAFESAQREHGNIRAVIAGLGRFGRDIGRGIELLTKVSLLWQVRGYVADGSASATALLGAGDSEASALTGKLLVEAATFARLEGDYPRARALVERGIVVSKACHDTVLEADAEFAHGIIDYTCSNLPVSLERLSQAQRLYRACGAEAQVGLCGANIALIHLSKRDYAASATAMAAAIASLRKAGHRRWLAAALGAMAYIERYRGNLNEAAAFSRDALAEGTRTGDRQLASSALANLSFVHVSRNDVRNATAYIVAGLELLRDGAFPFSVLSLFESAARLLILQKRYEDAASALAALAAIVERFSIMRGEDDHILVSSLDEVVSAHLPELDIVELRAAFRDRTIAECVRHVSRSVRTSR